MPIQSIFHANYDIFQDYQIEKQHYSYSRWTTPRM